MEAKAYRKLTKAEQKERADILRSGANYKGKDYEDYSHFDSMPPETARLLMKKTYAVASDAQNDSPTFREMVEFCEQHPGFMLHGYVIGGDRDDARITAEGVQGTAKDIDGLFDFVGLFGRADDCDFDRETLNCYCWYD